MSETPSQGLTTALEALLFISPGPAAPTQLAEALGQPLEQVEEALRMLAEALAESSGLRLQWHAGKVQLTTAPELAGLVEKFLGLEATARLSRAALESLAIIAYRQPITRPAMDAIRGVNSDGVLKSLLSKGLVQEIGRAEGPGRPILYGTTGDFLQHFGLSSLADLPPYDVPDEGEEPAAEETRLLKD